MAKNGVPNGSLVELYANDALSYTANVSGTDSILSIAGFYVDNVLQADVKPELKDHKVSDFTFSLNTSKVGDNSATVELKYTKATLDHYNYTYSDKDQKVKSDSTAVYKDEEVTLQAVATFKTYAVPTFTNLKIVSQGNKQKGFKSDTFELSPDGLNPATNGYPNSWAYEWYVDDALKATTERFSLSAADLAKGNRRVKLVVKNKINGNDSYMRSNDSNPATFSIEVFDNPDFTGLNISSSPVKAHVENAADRTFSFSSSNSKNTTGDPSGWTYSWTFGGKNYTGASFTSDNLSAGTYEAVLTATNTIQGTDYKQSGTTRYSVTVFTNGSLGTVSCPKNVIEGKVYTIKAKLNGGENGKWTTATATVGSDSRTVTSFYDNEASFNFTAPSLNGAEKGSVTLTNISAENQPDGCPDKASFSTSRSDLISVWKTPYVKQLSASDGSNFLTSGVTDVKIESNTRLAVNLEGGVRDGNGSPRFDSTNGWVCRWTIDGETTGSNSDTYLLTKNDGEAHDYMVTVTSYVDGNVASTTTYSWTKVIIWPTPVEPKVAIEGFEGERAYIYFEQNSGYTGFKAAGWKYKYRKVGTTEWIGEDKFYNDSPYSVATDSGSSAEDEYEWSAINYWIDGSVWAEFVGQTKAVVAQQPSLFCPEYSDFKYEKDPVTGESAFTGIAHVYFDNGINFNLDKIQGLDGLWRVFELRYNQIGTSDFDKAPEFGDLQKNIGETLIRPNIYNVINNKDSYQDVHIKGTVYNGRINAPNEKKIKVDLTFRVWPKLKVTGLKAEPEAVREGDNVTITAQINDCYLSKENRATIVYEYIFGENVQKGIEGSMTLPSWMSAGDTKGIEKIPATTRVHLYSPYGSDEWAILDPIENHPKDESTGSAEVAVYRRPKMIENLEVFGDGKTNTYFISMEDNDDQLDAQGYHYNFSDGSHNFDRDHRWVVVPDDWNAGNLRAATYWDYSSNIRIYSDYRTMEGKTVRCDLSRIGDLDSRGVDAGSESGVMPVTLDEQHTDKGVYDMTGRRVENLQSGRLYIIGGKKVIGK